MYPYKFTPILNDSAEPHKPKPPTSSVLPSRISATAAAALGNTFELSCYCENTSCKLLSQATLIIITYSLLQCANIASSPKLG